VAVEEGMIGLMAEDLTRMWGNFSLTEEEDVEIEIQKEAMEGMVSRGKSCLEGKLISDHFVSKEAIKSTLICWWKPFGQLTFKVLGENLFLIEFEHSKDKSRVLDWRPWIF
jgi:hypothetical protein